MAHYPMLSPSFYQLCFYIFSHLCRLNNQHHAALLLHLFCLLVYHIFPIFAPFWGSILLDSPNHCMDQCICALEVPNQLWVLVACQLLCVYQLNHHLLVFLLFLSHIHPNLVAASQLHDNSHMMAYCDIFFQSLPHYHMDNLCIFLMSFSQPCRPKLTRQYASICAECTFGNVSRFVSIKDFLC